MSTLLSRNSRRPQGGGNRLTTPAADLWRRNMALERGTEIGEEPRRSATEDFIVGAVLDYAAEVYVCAYYNRESRKDLWVGLCKNLNLKPPKYVFGSTSSSTGMHFNKHATMVLEESLCSISTALAERWIDKRTAPAVSKTSSTKKKDVKYYATPQQKLSFNHTEKAHQNKCRPMRMDLIDRRSNSRSKVSFFKFELPSNSSGFTKDQLFHIRPGSIVECLPTGKGGLANVVLGAICHTNRAVASKSRTFTVMLSPSSLHEHMDSTEWWIQPLASLVSEMRQLETCQMILRGQVKPPFLHLINGRASDMQLLSQQEQEQEQELQSQISGNETRVPSPTSVMELDSSFQRGWNIPKLNRSQEKAATKFLASSHGTISLVQGPPGTGKTTFLVSTVCHYLLKSLQEDQENHNAREGIVEEQVRLTNRPLLVSAPSNKAVLVLVSRFLAAIAEDDGRDREIRIALVGDEDKLMEGTCSSASSEGTVPTTAQCQSQVTIKHIFVYKFLPNLLSCLDSIEKHLRTNVEEGITIHHSHVVFRLLAQFIDIGHLFKAGVKSRAEKLRTSLLAMAARKCSEPFNRTTLEHLGSLLKVLGPLAQKSDLVHKVTCGLIRSADVIFCTLAASGCNIFKQREPLKIRDLIVDEAAAATEPELAIPFHLEPDRLLAVGDPMQLPATVLSPIAKLFGLSKSLHQRLMNECGFPYIMLKKQYRMRKEIAEFPSRQFYSGKLKNSGKVKKSSYRGHSPILEPSQNPFFFQDVEGREVRLENGSYRNYEEARAVFDWVCKLKAKASAKDPNWFRGDKVRIITFYHAQVQLINNMLRQIGYGTGKSGLVAATVDSSQGCEADVVIVSFVRTCHAQNASPHSVAGFLTQDQRINVALTRAKYELICVGSARNMLKNSSIRTLQSLASEALLRKSMGMKRKSERTEPMSKRPKLAQAEACQ